MHYAVLIISQLQISGAKCIFSHRFILENFVLDKHVRYILTIYPAVIWALTGVFTKNYDAANPSHNNIFIGEKLGYLNKSHKITENLYISPTSNMGQIINCRLILPSDMFFLL